MRYSGCNCQRCQRSGKRSSSGCPRLLHRFGASRAGIIRSDSNPVRLSATPAHYEKSAPLLGEDNRHVFVELLGMDEERFKSLVDEGNSRLKGPPVNLTSRQYSHLHLCVCYFVRLYQTGVHIQLTRSAYYRLLLVPNCLS